ncbi:response regulator [Hymenobacter sp. 5516J-16]|uniref:response regulator n=1 Tax=Hymenobacter sp. 5516J-16 TaxID=2932253 RepID=UPI001FD612FA|nr:response regulator [Hymenobacter sp. 5516J-16]UOQ78247.1 response regulator [Hymenobacter sp. 5516J-16]
MKKILLVEDSDTDRAVLRRYLSRNPGETLELHEATTVAEAVVAFQRYQPDCVLIDYNLPDGTGLEVLEQFKQLVPVERLCVVMITGIDSGELAVQALNNGALDYLIKHRFDQDMLLKVVRHAIERNEWRQHQARYHADLERINQELRQSLAELTATRQELAASNESLRTAHTEAQTRNRALDTANRQLARTNQDLDNFVYAASHDLKQPVQNLQGLFDELCRVVDFEEGESQLLISMTKASLHDLLTTIDDLSVIVQDTRQPLSATQEEVALAELTDDIQQALARSYALPQLSSTMTFRPCPRCITTGVICALFC